MSGNWQRRWHPLLDQWVLISARSAARPWSGAMATTRAVESPAHDPECYLCPRVVRANGEANPDYRGAFAFENDFPALSFDAPVAAPDDNGDTPASTVNRTAPAHGRCRVLCWSERHDQTLASLSLENIHNVARLWQSEYRDLSAHADIANVLIFENKGTEIGVSNLHPHGQIYASSFLTDTAERMRLAQANFARANKGESLVQSLRLDDYTQAHLIIEEGMYFTVMVPFAARFAYETWIVPNRHVKSLSDMSDDEIRELAELYQRQVHRYDLLFQRSAPNITLLHNSPCDTNSTESEMNRHWCFHLAFQPPLRDATKMKFLAGFESGSNNIVNPVLPEQAAEQLRHIDTQRWQA